METCTVQKAHVQVPKSSDDSIKETIGGKRDRDASMDVGGDGTACPSSKEAAIATESMGCINEGQFGDSNFEDERYATNLGPWMLSKKVFRKRNKVSMPPKVSKSHGVKDKMGQREQVGSRFNILNVEKVVCDGSNGKELVVFVEGDKECGPSSSPLVGEAPIQRNLGLASLSRVRNSAGGKNPQVGSSIRDIKKTARANSPYMKPLNSSNGGVGPKSKVNNASFISGASKGNLTTGKAMDTVSDKLGMEKTKFLEGLKILPLDKKGLALKSGVAPVQEQNILVGPIVDGTSLDTPKKFDDLNQLDSAVVCEQMGIKLSEQTVKIVSQ